jgi:peptidyl-prolyl cis-trans isomerase C
VSRVTGRMLTLAAAFAIAVSCASPAADDNQRTSTAAPVPRELPAVVARVNDEMIERWEVEAAVREITLANLHPLPQAERDELMRAVVDRLIEHHLASQAARARGVAATEAEVDADLREMRSEHANDRQFAERLATAGISAEQLRHQRQLSVDMTKLVHAAAGAAISDAAINAYYRDNRDRFLLPEAVTASHILIRVNPDATAEQRADARRARPASAIRFSAAPTSAGPRATSRKTAAPHSPAAWSARSPAGR